MLFPPKIGRECSQKNMRNTSLALLFFVLLAFDANANEHPAAVQRITPRLRTQRMFSPPGKTNIYGSLNITKDDLGNSEFEDCAAIEFVSRNGWNAKPTKDANYLKVTGGVGLVFYHHTEGDMCYSTKDCAEIIRKWQEYHQLDKGWDDIAYNFLIGDDGRVYVGRDWDRIGAHTLYYNNVSLSYGFVGNFTHLVPSNTMLTAAEKLTACGIQMGKIRPNYTLHGQRDANHRDCPGEAFYNLIENFTNFGGRLEPYIY